MRRRRLRRLEDGGHRDCRVRDMRVRVGPHVELKTDARLALELLDVVLRLRPLAPADLLDRRVADQVERAEVVGPAGEAGLAVLAPLGACAARSEVQAAPRRLLGLAQRGGDERHGRHPARLRAGLAR